MPYNKECYFMGSFQPKQSDGFNEISAWLGMEIGGA